jgi:hypothetical protein
MYLSKNAFFFHTRTQQTKQVLGVLSWLPLPKSSHCWMTWVFHGIDERFSANQLEGVIYMYIRHRISYNFYDIAEQNIHGHMYLLSNRYTSLVFSDFLIWLFKFNRIFWHSFEVQPREHVLLSSTYPSDRISDSTIWIPNSNCFMSILLQYCLSRIVDCWLFIYDYHHTEPRAEW